MHRLTLCRKPHLQSLCMLGKIVWVGQGEYVLRGIAGEQLVAPQTLGPLPELQTALTVAAAM